MKDAAAQCQVRSVPGLCRGIARHSAHISGDIGPGLRRVHVPPRHDMMHRVVFAFITGEIGQLTNNISKSLAGKRRNAATAITESCPPVATDALGAIQAATVLGLRV